MAFARTTVASLALVLLVGVAGAHAAPPPTSVATQHLTVKDCHTTPFVFGGPWKLLYSFGGGIMPGQGVVHLVLHSNGKAVVTTQLYKKPKHVKHVQVPQPAMGKLMKVLSKWPPSCIRTHVRQGYFVADVGHTSISVVRAGKTSTSVIDPCHYVDNVDGFQAIYDALGALEPYLGPAIKWFAGAATTVKSDACTRPRPAPNSSVKRTQTR